MLFTNICHGYWEHRAVGMPNSHCELGTALEMIMDIFRIVCAWSWIVHFGPWEKVPAADGVQGLLPFRSARFAGSVLRWSRSFSPVVCETAVTLFAVYRGRLRSPLIGYFGAEGGG
jgi:hypothetical protein